MAVIYNIFGKQVASQYLALATIGAIALVAMPNPFASRKPRTVEFNASSVEEEAFIRSYLEKHQSSNHGNH